ncbi:MAG: GNAT family N-acetyltransferase [Thermoplasmata archaeon]|nr:MAG: GNAT family N-acetyltransferase [Thermoplasmata archaeon]
MTQADKRTSEPRDGIEIGLIRKDEGEVAGSVAARAFAPTPMPSVTMRGSEEKRTRLMKKAMKTLVTNMPGEVYVARSNGDVVGVMRAVESPECQPSRGVAMVKPLMMYALLGRSAKRVLHFRGEWRRRDPGEPHLHLDPLAVAPEHQGQGIGSQLLERFSQIADDRRIGAYLETDAEANVRLYERFGFHVMETKEIFGVTNYFMWREPRGG